MCARSTHYDVVTKGLYICFAIIISMWSVGCGQENTAYLIDKDANGKPITTFRKRLFDDDMKRIPWYKGAWEQRDGGPDFNDGGKEISEGYTPVRGFLKKRELESDRRIHRDIAYLQHVECEFGL